MTQATLDTTRAGDSAPHVYEFHVRFGDIDVLGHVNNCRYLTYLEDARIAMFRLDPMREGREPMEGLVIARHEIDYKRPLTLRLEPVRVETRVTELRAASFGLAYDVRDDEHVYARATSRIVAYDVEQGRTRRLTAHEIASMKAYL